jgi:hypothetical protein
MVTALGSCEVALSRTAGPRETAAEEEYVPHVVSETCSSSSRTLIRIAWNTRASSASPLSSM